MAISVIRRGRLLAKRRWWKINYGRSRELTPAIWFFFFFSGNPPPTSAGWLADSVDGAGRDYVNAVSLIRMGRSSRAATMLLPHL